MMLAIYDPDGVIVRTVEADMTYLQPVMDTEPRWILCETCNADDYYVNVDVEPHELLPRPKLGKFDKIRIAADDVDEAVLTGLPNPVEVRVDNDIFTVTDGELRISSPMPAIYRVEVTAPWPYIRYATVVSAE